MGLCYILCPYNRELKWAGSCKGNVLLTLPTKCILPFLETTLQIIARLHDTQHT